MLISLGLAFEIIQFVTQYGFYPEALMRDHPLPQVAFQQRAVRPLRLPLLQTGARNRDRDLAEPVARGSGPLSLRRHGTGFRRPHRPLRRRKALDRRRTVNDLKEVLLSFWPRPRQGLIGDFLVAKLRPTVRKSQRI